MDPDPQDARSALDRAHRAARSLESGELRRALQDALDALGPQDEDPVAYKVARALELLPEGPLDDAERLIEEARAALPPV